MRNTHRVFVAINFPDSVKEKIWHYVGEFQNMPIRPTRKENLHLTLVFIGDVFSDELPSVIQALDTISKRHRPLAFRFSKIIYGPSNKKPRMIWLVGDLPKALAELQKEVRDTIGKLNLRFFRAESRPYTPHVTLARIPTSAWKNYHQKPETIYVSVDIRVEVESIDLMESNLTPKGPEYILLKAFKL